MSVNHNPLINHIINKPRLKAGDKKTASTYIENNRIRRSKELCNTKEYDDFINRLRKIQRKFELTNDKFSKVLGITLRTLYRYYGKSGNLPSLKMWRKVNELEKATEIDINMISIKIGIK